MEVNVTIGGGQKMTLSTSQHKKGTEFRSCWTFGVHSGMIGYADTNCSSNWCFLDARQESPRSARTDI